MRQTIFSLIMTILSVLLSAAILLQQRGSGLGLAFGGDSAIFRTKRGIEKGLFYTTIVLACLFFGFSVVNILL